MCGPGGGGGGGGGGSSGPPSPWAGNTEISTSAPGSRWAGNAIGGAMNGVTGSKAIPAQPAAPAVITEGAPVYDDAVFSEYGGEAGPSAATAFLAPGGVILRPGKNVGVRVPPIDGTGSMKVVR